MAYTDDWENLMNGVFGAGGRPRFGGTAQPESKTPKAKAPAVPDLNAALLENQKQLDALLIKQNAQLKTQDTAVQAALEDSRQMLRDMEADGLLAKGTADTKPEQLGSFEGLAAEVKKTVLGQDAFVDSVVRAMRRPFVLGTEGAAARNVILLWGAPGTGRHFALAETARIMAARGLLQSDRMAVMDLALYPDPGAENLFLQDLYAALHAPGEIVVFEHYESCHPGFLRILSDLAVKGNAPLSSRYLVNKEGILVEAGTALAPGAVSRIDPCGKYLIFFSRKGREALADKFGASFVAAVGDVCQTVPFTPDALAALAAQQLNALAQRVHSRLGLTLTAGAEVRDYVAAQCSKEKGAEGLADCCERIFRALSEYCLQTDAKLSGTVALTAAPEGLQFALNGAAPADLFSLLPAAYTGAVEQIRAELDALVGLAPVKEYVFGLADNLQVQQRRAAAQKNSRHGTGIQSALRNGGEQAMDIGVCLPVNNFSGILVDMDSIAAQHAFHLCRRHRQAQRAADLLTDLIQTVHEAKVNIICFQLLQLPCDGFFDAVQRRVPAVFAGGIVRAEMQLYIRVLPPSGKGFADAGENSGVTACKIDIVDTAVQRERHRLHDVLNGVFSDNRGS